MQILSFVKLKAVYIKYINFNFIHYSTRGNKYKGLTERKLRACMQMKTNESLSERME